MKTLSYLAVCALLAVAYILYVIDYRRRGMG